MPSAFSTTNTPEADDAEIVLLGQAKAATRRAAEINVSRDAKIRNFRISTSWAIAIYGALFIATGAAMFEAERYYKYHDNINQGADHVASR